MKDRFEAKLILFIIPALAIWEVLYQLVIIRLIPAAKNDTVHGVGFVNVSTEEGSHLLSTNEVLMRIE